MKHFKQFEYHTGYESYIESENKLLPNMSYCEDADDIHFNTTIFYFTPKELVEFICNLLIMIFNKYDYNQIHEQNFYNKIKNIYNIFGIRFRNINSIKCCDFAIFSNDKTENQNILFDFDLNAEITGYLSGNYKGEELSYQLSMTTDLLDEWNDNYIFKGYSNLMQTGPGYEFTDEELEYFKTHICFMFPKTITCLNTQEELAQVSLVFIDNNGNYTLTPPENSQMLINNININPESISMSLFSSINTEINTRVNAAITNIRNCPFSIINTDFNEFDALNDIKIPITFKQYNFIKNPMNYF